ncbi:Magnesium-protoporphyrin IX monomethyl ester (Oxidative) cyclase OS=Streptomyces albaduncus OX=68172 GN=FHS32_004178 PE=4 SV=1 [Streptomyces griseoloalbus]
MVPTTLPLDRFYEELVRTQAVINRKHLGLRTAFGAARVLARNLATGRRTSPACCGSSTRSTTRAGSSPTTRVRCVTNRRLPQRLDVGDRRQLYVHTRGATQGAPARRLPD